jgi:hypothetical protein
VWIWWIEKGGGVACGSTKEREMRREKKVKIK